MSSSRLSLIPYKRATAPRIAPIIPPTAGTLPWPARPELRALEDVADAAAAEDAELAVLFDVLFEQEAELGCSYCVSTVLVQR